MVGLLPGVVTVTSHPDPKGGGDARTRTRHACSRTLHVGEAVGTVLGTETREGLCGAVSSVLSPPSQHRAPRGGPVIAGGLREGPCSGPHQRLVSQHTQAASASQVGSFNWAF